MVDEAIRGQLAQLYVAAVVAGGIVLVTMPRGLRLRDYQQKIPGQRGRGGHDRRRRDNGAACLPTHQLPTHHAQTPNTVEYTTG